MSSTASKSKHLVIVESPAKAKTIEKYLGKEFTVLSSVGHIRSIAKKTGDGTPPIDTKSGYKTVYEVDPEKKKIAAELRKAVKATGDVWLATDEDREGEAIAWHLCEVLKLDPKKTKRIVFHEITKSAIEEAIKNPRTVDMNLVKAQQARQILDRLVGFELSPVVWQKVPGGKSAGRVQSPAVRLLVEREREIEKFEGSYNFKVTAVFTIPRAIHGAKELKAELPQRFDTEKEAQKFLESLHGATFTVADVTTSPATRNPMPPFTTSSLQIEANSRLGFGARATMTSAQKLYQEGKITYMRTDSVNLSKQALAQMSDFIQKTYGEKYHQFRTYQTKSASAQEAHEAIRPTHIATEKGSSNEYDQKLYDLIRRRALASQMAPAQIERTTVTIKVSSSKHNFEAKGEVIIFDGFLKVYGRNKNNDEENILPPVESGDALKLGSANARQTFARPPARYTEGSLVKKLEELGIGRPSTYATIINTVQVRGYAAKGENEGTDRDVIVLDLGKSGVEKSVIQEKTGSDRGKLVPTAAGIVVSDFLQNHFDQIVDYGFTADVEEEFDEIARGKLERNKMLDEFYHPFHKLISGSGKIDRAEVAQAREVGIDKKTGKPILARFGRFGPMLQLGETPDKDDKDPNNKPLFAPMPAGARLETVTLEQAMKAFELPRVVGTTEDGQEIKANIGRFGPYIQVGKLFVSIKPLDPNTIKEGEARKLYAAKLKAEAEKHIQTFEGSGIQVLNGRYGPYITDGTKNAKIPKEKDPKKLTEAQCKKLLEEAPAKKPFRRFAKKT
jgi:DNA topoisomerase-1